MYGMGSWDRGPPTSTDAFPPHPYYQQPPNYSHDYSRHSRYPFPQPYSYPPPPPSQHYPAIFPYPTNSPAYPRIKQEEPEETASFDEYMTQLRRHQRTIADGRSLRCQWNHCDWTVLPKPDQPPPSLGALEAHILRHFPDLRLYRCLRCHTFIPSIRDHIDAHFGLEPRYEDLRPAHVPQLLRGLHRCFAAQRPPPKGPIEIVELSDSDDEIETLQVLPLPKAVSPAPLVTTSLGDTPATLPSEGITTAVEELRSQEEAVVSGGVRVEEATSTSEETPPLQMLPSQLPELRHPRILAALALLQSLPPCQISGCGAEVPLHRGPALVLDHVFRHSPAASFFCHSCQIHVKVPREHVLLCHEPSLLPAFDDHSSMHEEQHWRIFLECFPPRQPPQTSRPPQLSQSQPTASERPCESETADDETKSEYEREVSVFLRAMGSRCVFVPCIVANCAKKVKPTFFSIDTHARKHFNQPVFRCHLCRKNIRFIGPHFAQRHPGKPQTSVTDLRPTIGPALIANFKACFRLCNDNVDSPSQALSPPLKPAQPTPVSVAEPRPIIESVPMNSSQVAVVPEKTSEHPIPEPKCPELRSEAEEAAPKQSKQAEPETPAEVPEESEGKMEKVIKSEPLEAANGRPLRYLAELEAVCRWTKGALKCQLCSQSYRRRGLILLNGHLFTHCDRPAWQCLKCETAVKGSQQAHAKSQHAAEEIGSADFRDLRVEFEEELIQLSRRCFGQPPPLPPPKSAPSPRRIKTEPGQDSASSSTRTDHRLKSASATRSPLNKKNVEVREPTDFSDIGEPSQSGATAAQLAKPRLSVAARWLKPNCDSVTTDFASSTASSMPADSLHSEVEEDGSRQTLESGSSSQQTLEDGLSLGSSMVVKAEAVEEEDEGVRAAVAFTKAGVRDMFAAVRRQLAAKKSIPCHWEGCNSVWTCLKNVDSLSAHIMRHLNLDELFLCLLCQQKTPSINLHHQRCHKGQGKSFKDLRYQYRQRILEGMRDCLLPGTAIPDPGNSPATPSQRKRRTPEAKTSPSGPSELIEAPPRRKARVEGEEIPRAELNERAVRLYEALLSTIALDVAFGSKVSCQFYSCQTRWKDLVEVPNLDRHILNHVGRQGFRCRLCKAAVNEPAAHRKRKHPDHSGTLRFRDLRPTFANELMDTFHDCFPEARLTPRKVAKQRRRLSLRHSPSPPPPPSASTKSPPAATKPSSAPPMPESEPYPPSAYLASLQSLEKAPWGVLCQMPECRKESEEDSIRVATAASAHEHVLHHSGLVCFECVSCGGVKVSDEKTHLAEAHGGSGEVLFRDLRPELESQLAATFAACFQYPSERDARVLLTKLSEAEAAKHRWDPKSPSPPSTAAASPPSAQDQSLIATAMLLLQQSVDVKSLRQRREGADKTTGVEMKKTTGVTVKKTTGVTVKKEPKSEEEEMSPLPERVGLKGQLRCRGSGCSWRQAGYRRARVESHILEHERLAGWECLLCHRRTSNPSRHMAVDHKGQPRSFKDLRAKLRLRIRAAARRLFPSLAPFLP